MYRNFTYFIFVDRTVKRGCLIIDSSTIDPSVAQDVALLADKKGALYMDAPVSGGRYKTVL